jgi:hypothetical protein
MVRKMGMSTVELTDIGGRMVFDGDYDRDEADADDDSVF